MILWSGGGQWAGTASAGREPFGDGCAAALVGGGDAWARARRSRMVPCRLARATASSEGGALEDRADPHRAGSGDELQALDPEGERVVGDDRAPHVGSSAELRGAEEHGGDGGEQVAGSDRGGERAGLHREQHAGEAGHRGRGNQRAPHETVGAHAGEARRLGVAAGGVQAAPERRLLEHEPHDRGDHEQVDARRPGPRRTAGARSPCTARRTRR